MLLSARAFAAPVASAAGADIPLAVNPVNPGAIPIGDGRLSTSPVAGSVYSCQTSFSGGGAQNIGPWVDLQAGTWNSTAKVHVEGSVSWPQASFSVQVSGNQRVITGNDLPVNDTSGTFPISPGDPAYQYDRNPNSIAPQDFTLRLPATPGLANAISCVPLGAIGVLTDGVFLFNALDDAGRDAGAHEVQDACDGHPNGADAYHHHTLPACILSRTGGPDSSTLVGYALDGFGIYVEKDANGNLLTNGNLDACHGRVSQVMWDGQPTTIFHYDATLEYPYTVGCFEGTPAHTPYTGAINSTTPVTTTTTITSVTTSTSTSPATSTTSAQPTTVSTTSTTSTNLKTPRSNSSSTSVTQTSATTSGATSSSSTATETSTSAAQPAPGGGLLASPVLGVAAVAAGALLVAAYLFTRRRRSA